MSKDIDRLSTQLKSAGYSLTNVRKTIFQCLLNAEPQTVSEITKSVADAVDRASVYRTITLFEQLGIVERLQLGWKYKIELSDSFAAHHHHISCITCGKVQSFEESSIIAFELKQLAQEAGYTETGHQLELRGVCSSCKQ